MRIPHIHAQFGEFEFVPAGTLQLFRRKYGDGLKPKVIVCTGGPVRASCSHHKETGRVRLNFKSVTSEQQSVRFFSQTEVISISR